MHACRRVSDAIHKPKPSLYQEIFRRDGRFEICFKVCTMLRRGFEEATALTSLRNDTNFIALRYQRCLNGFVRIGFTELGADSCSVMPMSTLIAA